MVGILGVPARDAGRRADAGNCLEWALGPTLRPRGSIGDRRLPPKIKYVRYCARVSPKSVRPDEIATQAAQGQAGARGVDRYITVTSAPRTPPKSHTAHWADLTVMVHTCAKTVFLLSPASQLGAGARAVHWKHMDEFTFREAKEDSNALTVLTGCDRG
mgnify:CR=1 FL=1